jgi:aconitate decarboxylase
MQWPAMPAIWAEAHRLQASGAELLRAYVVGYEVWAELFSREPEQYHLKGWHPTGVFGVVGAAAAVAYLNRAALNPLQAAQALSIAASSASGLVANFGTMTKPWHAGRAASAAIDAVRLAQLGMTAATDVFEHHAGFLAALSPSGQFDAQRPAFIGGVPRLLEWGVSIKRYPVCYSGHRVIDGVLQLAADHGLQHGDVAQVDVTIGTAQASMLRNHLPVTGLEAKFSIEFDVASALVAGDVGLSQLTDAFTHQSAMQALMRCVKVHITARNCPIDPAFSYADSVRITTRDGRMLDSGDIRFPKGHAMHPLSAAELRSKFLDCVAYSGLACDGPALYQQLLALGTLPNVRTLAQWL